MYGKVSHTSTFSFIDSEEEHFEFLIVGISSKFNIT